MLREALSVKRYEPRDSVVHQIKLNLRVVKLGLNCWQKAILPEDFLQDRSLGSNSVHLDVIVRRHVGFNNHDKGPKGVLLVKHFSEAKHQEVEPLDIAYGWVPPYVRLYDSRDRLFNFICVELIIWKGSADVSFILLKHLVRVAV